MANEPTAETLAAVSAEWDARWAPAAPGTRESYLFGSGISLLFDRLPTLHTHAEQAVEYAETVFRSLSLLRALSDTVTDRRVFVSSFSWSNGPDPVGRDSWIERFLPATLWHSTVERSWMADPDAPDELPVYEHTWVTELSLDDPALAAAVTLAANGEDLVVYPRDASWVFTSVEAGAHVRTGGGRASLLVKQCSEWVGKATHERPTKVSLDDVRGWQIDFSYLDERAAGQILDLAETQGLLPWPVQGRLVDPRDELIVSLSREQGQRLRILTSDEPGVVVDDWTGSSHEMTPAMVREEMEGGHASLGDLDEFLDEVGYRHPAEAQNGHLPRHFWNPRHNYDGIEGSAAEGS